MSKAPVEQDKKRDTILPDANEFREKVIGAYRRGAGADDLPSDETAARSLIPPGTAALRDFSYIAPDFPALEREKCVGCMECVTKCHDTAILAKVIGKSDLAKELAQVGDAAERERLEKRFAETTKYYSAIEKKGEEGGLFGLFVDPTKCKGCAECVEVCGIHEALSMVHKTPESV